MSQNRSVEDPRAERAAFGFPSWLPLSFWDIGPDNGGPDTVSTDCAGLSSERLQRRGNPDDLCFRIPEFSDRVMCGYPCHGQRRNASYNTHPLDE